MKLLFDQNLSPRLVTLLADLFPGSSHVSLVGLDRSDDVIVWDYARDNEFLLVTKDADFGELSMLRGSSPKVIWLRLGNCSTNQVEGLLRLHYQAVERLVETDNIGVLSLT